MASFTRDRPASTSSSSLPPRVLNVQKFAESRSAELEALHAIISCRNEGKFHLQRSKRRRTSSHDARIARSKNGRKKPKLEKKEGLNEKSNEEKKISRRVRRRRMFRKNMEFGFSVSGDGTERLRTHLWHAKRFTMIKRWGFYLPLGVHGRGRGSRALLKRLKSGALLHDASYLTAIQLAGREDSILTILKKILVQPQFNSSERSSQLVLHGICHHTAMLHHSGAPLSRFICPVTYMWRPVRSDALRGVSRMNDVSTSNRQLRIWVHASAFDEAFGVLSMASREQATDDGAPVTCISLKGKLGKLELIGSEATQILHKVFHSSSDIWKSKLSMIFKEAEKIPTHAVISLDILDPRESSLRGTYDEDVQVQSDLPKEESVKDPSTAPAESSKLHGVNMLSLWSDPSQFAEFFCDSKELWDSHDELKPPIDDSILCLEKHHKRLQVFYMDERKPATLSGESQECGSRTCPALLLKRNFQNTALNGWSIILPLSWIKPFWVSLVSCGARAIGLREKRWVALEGRMPCFPFDFPDCKAYVALMNDVASEFDQMADLRPPSVRPTRVPIPSPWDCIKSSIRNFPEVVQEKDLADSEILSFLSSRVDSFTETCSSLAQSMDPLSFPGSVMRSGDVLHQFLKDIKGAHLLLFQNCEMGKKAFSSLIERERMSWIPRSMSRLSADRSPLFSRVLLCPCREGAFDEGAVVCAPLFSDILSMSSRVEEREKLQISQSMVNSYFMQVESGRWVMSAPRDPFHRWPIGFVTSGSTHGSAHPVALAVCEVTLLAQLREQQWSQMLHKSKPDVFVLVRNLRSTAYRLCSASILLEKGDDFDFV